jgi:Protein of unknown function (DUF4007)
MTVAVQTKSRFEYGRHETFAVRYGWLGKGLRRMEASHDGFQGDEHDVVALGLGSRMVKSLRYWLEASGLGELRAAKDEGRRVRRLHASAFGSAVLELDPWLEYPATWWMIHVNLARRFTSVWGWFFNDFRERVFDRPASVDAYLRHLLLHAANQPSLATTQRDIACLLLAYAAPAAGQPTDPEDSTFSPLRNLGLVLRHEDTGRFEKARPLDRIPLEAFLACADAQAQDLGQESLSTGDMVGRRGGPGLVFGLNGDAVEELATWAARDYASLGVTLDLLGAERRLRVPPAEDMRFWLVRHFARTRTNI